MLMLLLYGSQKVNTKYVPIFSLELYENHHEKKAWHLSSMYVYVCELVCVYIYIYIHICTYIDVCI